MKLQQTLPWNTTSLMKKKLLLHSHLEVNIKESGFKLSKTMVKLKKFNMFSIRTNFERFRWIQFFVKLQIIHISGYIFGRLTITSHNRKIFNFSVLLCIPKFTHILFSYWQLWDLLKQSITVVAAFMVNLHFITSLKYVVS